MALLRARDGDRTQEGNMVLLRWKMERCLFQREVTWRPHWDRASASFSSTRGATWGQRDFVFSFSVQHAMRKALDIVIWVAYQKVPNCHFS